MKWKIDNGIPIFIFETGRFIPTLLKTQDINGTVRTFSITIDAEKGIIGNELIKTEKPIEKSLGKISTGEAKSEKPN